MPRVPMTPVERHANHHRLIAERYEAWRSAPRRSSLDKIRRRELEKKAWWTFTGHLRGEHAVRGQAPFLRKSWADLEVIHDHKHEEEEEDLW